MKAFILLLCFAGLVFGSEPIEGFRGVKFGDTVDKLEKYALVDTSKDNREKYYKKTDEKLSIGEAKIDSLYYKFCNNKLCSVIGSYSGAAHNLLINVFSAKYGEPKEYERGLERAFIFGDTKDKFLLVTRNEVTEKGSFILDDSKIETKMQEERAKEAAKTDL